MGPILECDGKWVGAQLLMYLYRFQVSKYEVYLSGTAVVCNIVLWADHEQDNQRNVGLSCPFRSLRQRAIVNNYRPRLVNWGLEQISRNTYSLSLPSASNE